MTSLSLNDGMRSGCGITDANIGAVAYLAKIEVALPAYLIVVKI